MKAKSTAASPWLRIGQKPRGAWRMKYATASSPATRKATGLVKSPMSRSEPPNVSSTLAVPARESRATGARGPVEGTPKSFWTPCVTKRNATTIRSTLWRYGAHRGGMGPVMGRDLRVSGGSGRGRRGGGPSRRRAGRAVADDDRDQAHIALERRNCRGRAGEPCGVHVVADRTKLVFWRSGLRVPARPMPVLMV